MKKIKHYQALFSRDNTVQCEKFFYSCKEHALLHVERAGSYEFKFIRLFTEGLCLELEHDLHDLMRETNKEKEERKFESLKTSILDSI